MRNPMQLVAHGVRAGIVAVLVSASLAVAGDGAPVSHPRAALDQWWVPQGAAAIQTIRVGGQPTHCAADGESIWVAVSDRVVQVNASTGRVVAQWTFDDEVVDARHVLPVAGKVYVLSRTAPGRLYVIDPTQAPGRATLVTRNLGENPVAMVFDGARIWTLDSGPSLVGSVSIVTPGPNLPYPVRTVVRGFIAPGGIAFDGKNVWVTDLELGTLHRLDRDGNSAQSVPLGSGASGIRFDGANLWVVNLLSGIVLVNPGSGEVVGRIPIDGPTIPTNAAFDGERMLVVDREGGTVFHAATRTFLGRFRIGEGLFPAGACSDGKHFWLPVYRTGELLRF